ncbi:MAG: hypothetical protein ACXABY_34270 [Candidatus Thorarchaeota archaeon]
MFDKSRTYLVVNHYDGILDEYSYHDLWQAEKKAKELSVENKETYYVIRVGMAVYPPNFMPKVEKWQ